MSKREWKAESERDGGERKAGVDGAAMDRPITKRKACGGRVACGPESRPHRKVGSVIVYVGPPNQEERADILRIRMWGMKTSLDVNDEKIAQMVCQSPFTGLRQH